MRGRPHRRGPHVLAAALRRRGQPDTNDLRTKANSLAATYRGEIEAGLEHLRMLSATTPNLIPMARAASERGTAARWRSCCNSTGSSQASAPGARWFAGKTRSLPGSSNVRPAWCDLAAVGGRQRSAVEPGQRRTIHRLVRAAGPRPVARRRRFLRGGHGLGDSVARAHGDPTGRTILELDRWTFCRCQLLGQRRPPVRRSCRLRWRVARRDLWRRRRGRRHHYVLVQPPGKFLGAHPYAINRCLRPKPSRVRSTTNVH